MHLRVLVLLLRGDKVLRADISLMQDALCHSALAVLSLVICSSARISLAKTPKLHSTGLIPTAAQWFVWEC